MCLSTFLSRVSCVSLLFLITILHIAFKVTEFSILCRISPLIELISSGLVLKHLSFSYLMVTFKPLEKSLLVYSKNSVSQKFQPGSFEPSEGLVWTLFCAKAGVTDFHG